MSAELRICALEGCVETFIPPRGAQHKQYCTERHQRIAEKHRYRVRHTEIARCPGCDGKRRSHVTLLISPRSRHGRRRLLTIEG